MEINIREQVLKQAWFQITVFAVFCVVAGWQAVPSVEGFVIEKAVAEVEEHVARGAHDEANLNHQVLLVLQYSTGKANLRAEIRDYESRIFTRRGSDDEKIIQEVEYYNRQIKLLKDELEDVEVPLAEARTQKAVYQQRIQERNK